MAKLGNKSDYETLRNARISENKAILESMGILRSAAELRSVITASSLPNKRPLNRISLEGPTRWSERLKNINSSPNSAPASDAGEGKEVVKSLFCDRGSRGGLYDSVVGICCHFCRQKTLCQEDNCKRCLHRDVNEPCIGKTECSSCHSTSGILCRTCLKIRYGEEIEEVRANKKWMCPHCIENKGLNPYWICNSSFCLKRRKMSPAGVSISQAREQGYKSLAHLIMDTLKQKLG